MRAFRPGWRSIAALCLLLAVVHTWPLATAPDTLSRNDNGDAMLNEWILAWIAYQLPRVPAHLFDANIFYPERDSLAFSEPLIVPALMGAPLAWLGASPVLVYNIVLILGFALTAWAGYALVFEWTRDRAAGMLAGSMFAFNTHTLTRLAHVQGIHAWGLPLTLLSADRLLRHGRVRDAIWLAVWMAAMAYTSGYLVVFGAIMTAVVAITRAPEWLPRATRIVPLYALAAVAAAAAVVPVYLPYRRVAQNLHMVRSLSSVSDFSATVTGYLAAAGRVHYATWSARFFENPVDAFFPGFVVIALATGAICWAFIARGTPDADADARVTRRRIIMLVAIAATGLILSLGTRTPVYGWVYHAFPPMQGLRAAARFGNLFLLGMAALAGIGLALARRRLPPRYAGLAAVALVAAANIESARAPFLYTKFEGIPPIYSLLRDDPSRVVLAEVPFYPAQAFFENAPYVLYSTAHWRKLMNGYSGYVPGSYRQNANVFWYFPEPHAVEAMRRAGVTHVMIHPEKFGDHAEEMWRTVAASPYLERVAVGATGIALYKLK
ncbi:MAG TPA: hypothetical protein VFJ02_17440 [Vicinamibacterales bacterium]|nr:hypothetical protein [Vicinamibacterales bacterium]